MLNFKEINWKLSKFDILLFRTIMLLFKIIVKSRLYDSFIHITEDNFTKLMQFH